MASLPMKDCTTPLEDARLLYSKDYMALVSSGVSGLSGGVQDAKVTQWGYAGWPPGPKPNPYKWTDPRSGVTWTLVTLDGKWMYQSSKDLRYFITASNLYEMQGLRKDTDGLIVDKPVGEPHPDQTNGWDNWKIAGLGAGWVALGLAGAYVAYKELNKYSVRKPWHRVAE